MPPAVRPLLVPLLLAAACATTSERTGDDASAARAEVDAPAALAKAAVVDHAGMRIAIPPTLRRARPDEIVFRAVRADPRIAIVLLRADEAVNPPEPPDLVFVLRAGPGMGKPFDRDMCREWAFNQAASASGDVDNIELVPSVDGPACRMTMTTARSTGVSAFFSNGRRSAGLMAIGAPEQTRGLIDAVAASFSFSSQDRVFGPTLDARLPDGYVSGGSREGRLHLTGFSKPDGPFDTRRSVVITSSPGDADGLRGDDAESCEVTGGNVEMVIGREVTRAEMLPVSDGARCVLHMAGDDPDVRTVIVPRVDNEDAAVVICSFARNDEGAVFGCIEAADSIRFRRGE